MLSGTAGLYPLPVESASDAAVTADLEESIGRTGPVGWYLAIESGHSVQVF